MKEINFEQEYYSEWVKPSPKYETAYNLWIDYYYLTEWYDQSVCSGRTDEGIAMPIGSYEYNIINRNAIELHKQLKEDAAKEDVDENTLQNAKRDVLRLSQYKINEIYNQLHKR